MMAHNVNLSNEYITAQASSGGALTNGGFLRFYDGVQPATADTPIVTQKMLAELRINNPAGNTMAGEFIFGDIAPEKSAPAGGKATWYRVVKADGKSAIRDGSIGKTGSDSDIELDNINIIVGAEIYIDDLKWKIPKGTKDK